MNKFISTPLKGVFIERFKILTGFVGSPEWWFNVFDSGACIAGGAAMFVIDQAQCICDVGDIDIWIPRKVDMTGHVESLCLWLDDNKLDHRVKVQNHIVTVFNPIINVQFVSAAFETDIATLLDGFDYDCVQCAIYLHIDRLLRNGKEISSLHTLVSKFAMEAHSSRQIKWINLRRWKFAKFASQKDRMTKERIQQREAKMLRKKFYPNGTKNIPKIVPHDCCQRDRNISDGYWHMITQNYLQRYSDCWQEIQSIYKNRQYQLNANQQFLLQSRQEGHEEDQVQEYILAMLENLKLDEETFKTAKIELKTSNNQWVQAPTVDDQRRLAFEKELVRWKLRYANTENASYQYAIRNLTLLADPTQTLSNVANSVISDGLKLNKNSEGFALGMYVDSQMHDCSTVDGIFNLIKRTFL